MVGARAPLPFALLLLASCSEPAPAPQPTASATASTAAPAVVAPAARGVAREVSEENDLYQFGYSYPAQAAAIPALAARFEADIVSQRAKLAAEAREGRKAAQEGDFPFRPYALEHAWQVVADVPGWLSLSASHYTFTGGAHGMTVFDSLVWDRGAGKALRPADLFASPQALSAAIRNPFCDALDREREAKRGEPVLRDDGNWMNACVDPVSQVVLLGSSDRRKFDRIGVLLAPYEAGPYAEGEYEVTLPVTPAVLAAVKPEYRPAFSVRR